MLPPPDCCILVPPRTSTAQLIVSRRHIADIRHAQSGLGRVLLADGEHKRRPFKANDSRNGQCSRPLGTKWEPWRGEVRREFRPSNWGRFRFCSFSALQLCAVIFVTVYSPRSA
jgi:hypothetical protein